MEGWVEVDQWPKIGGDWAGLSLLFGANAEIVLTDDSGTLSCFLRVWLEDPDGVATAYDGAVVAFAPGADGDPHHWALQFEEAARRACVWLDGAVKMISGTLGAAGDVLHQRRHYVGALANLTGGDLTIDTGATPGVVALDNLRFSATARHVYNTGFTPPTLPLPVPTLPDAAGTRFVWKMRETSAPPYFGTTFGDEVGLSRLPSDEPGRWPGVWALTPAGGTEP